MGALEGMLVLGFLMLMDSVTVVYFMDHHGLSEEEAGSIFSNDSVLGLMFSTPYLGWTVAFIVYPFMADRVRPRVFLFLAVFLCALTVLIAWGPSKMLQMPE